MHAEAQLRLRQKLDTIALEQSTTLTAQRRTAMSMVLKRHMTFAKRSAFLVRHNLHGEDTSLHLIAPEWWTNKYDLTHAATNTTEARQRYSISASIAAGDFLAALDEFLEFFGAPPNTLENWLLHAGRMPLPPYIQREPGADDAERYQTVFAREVGAVAAPTAGLHFDEALLEALRERGVHFGHVTLHVGAGTFQPVRVDDIREHRMHSEWLNVGAELVQQVRRTRAAGGRVVAVGTTVVRALESAMHVGELQPFAGETSIFLFPGVRIRSVDALLTNFHLPESTLLMLVSAFAGKDRILKAYEHAVRERYRFFSYGDAMLLWPESGLARLDDRG